MGDLEHSDPEAMTIDEDSAADADADEWRAQAEADRSALARLVAISKRLWAAPSSRSGEDIAERAAAMDAAEARLAGAPPPVAPAPLCTLMHEPEEGVFARCGKPAAYRGVCDTSSPEGYSCVPCRCKSCVPLAVDGAAPPSERPLDMHERSTIQDAVGSPGRLPDSHIERIWAAVAGLVRARNAADLESLRADRELLRAWGEAGIKRHLCQSIANTVAAGDAHSALTQRAHQLANEGRALALGRGKGEGR